MISSGERNIDGNECADVHAAFLAGRMMIFTHSVKREKTNKWKEWTPHNAKLTIHHIFLCIAIGGDRGGSSNRYHELLMAEKRNVKMRCQEDPKMRIASGRHPK